MFLLPPALQEWLPEGHLAHFISDTVDTLDLGAFHARYAGGGPRNQPFHPAMMVEVLLYDKPRGKDGRPKGGRYKRDFGTPKDTAQAALDPATLPHTAAMAATLQTDAGRKAYARRKSLAEPPNGWIKHVLRFRQFSVRGLKKVQAEWKLVCLAVNLWRMATMPAR